MGPAWMTGSWFLVPSSWLKTLQWDHACLARMTFLVLTLDGGWPFPVAS